MTRDDDIERAVLEYLATNPAAMDTVEGVCEIWLGCRFGVAQVEQALERLVVRRAVETCQSVGAPMYRSGLCTLN